MKPVHIRFFILCCFVLAFGSGCSPSRVANATVLPTDTPSAPTETFITSTASPRPLPSSTITPTSTPEPSPTVTQTPTITASSIPTLDNVASDKLVTEYLSTNGGCALPCIWGLTPGKSTVQEARQLMEYLNLQGYSEGEIYEGRTFTFDDNWMFGGQLIFYKRDELIQMIEFVVNDIELAPYYNLKNVLRYLGVPTYIDFYVVIGVPSDAPRPKLTSYEVEILYSSSQVDQLGVARPWATFSYNGAAVESHKIVSIEL